MQTEVYVVFELGWYLAYGSQGYHVVLNPKMASIFSSVKEACQREVDDCRIKKAPVAQPAAGKELKILQGVGSNPTWGTYLNCKGHLI